MNKMLKYDSASQLTSQLWIIKSHSCPKRHHWQMPNLKHIPLKTISFSRQSFIPGSLGWGPWRGRSHSIRWSWVLRSAGRSTGTQCASLCLPSPLGAGHVCLQRHTICEQLILFTQHAFVYSQNKGRKSGEVATDSVLRWCWSATWHLISVCWLLWCAAMSCWPCQPVSQSPQSPQGTGLAHLGTQRQESVHGFLSLKCCWNRWLTITHPKVCWHYSSGDGR